MKRFFIILALLLSFTAFSQQVGGPLIGTIRFKGDVTETVRDLIDVPDGEIWMIYNTTSQTLQWANGTDTWLEIDWKSVKLNANEFVGFNRTDRFSITDTGTGVAGFQIFGSSDDAYVQGGVVGNQHNLIVGPLGVRLPDQSNSVIDALGVAAALTKGYADTNYTYTEGAGINISGNSISVDASDAVFGNFALTTGGPSTQTFQQNTNAFTNVTVSGSLIGGEVQVANKSTPSNTSNGNIYYDTDTNQLLGRENGVWMHLGGNGDFLADGSVPMTGSLNMGGFAINNTPSISGLTSLAVAGSITGTAILPQTTLAQNIGNSSNIWGNLSIRDIFYYSNNSVPDLRFDVDSSEWFFSFNTDADRATYTKTYTLNPLGAINPTDLVPKSYVDSQVGGGGTDDQTASEVPYTNNSQTTVLGALDDLYTNKANITTANIFAQLQQFENQTIFKDVAGGDISTALLFAEEDGLTVKGSHGYSNNAGIASVYFSNNQSAERIRLLDAGGLSIEAESNMNNNKIINVADPTNAQDAATKAYADTKITEHPDSGIKGLTIGAGTQAQKDAANLVAGDIWILTEPEKHIYTVPITAQGGDISVGTGVTSFFTTQAITVTNVYASLSTAPTGSVATFDINEGGVSILSTPITIDASENTSGTATTPPVISDSSIASWAELSFDIDGIGSTVAGATGTIYIEYTIDQ